MTKTTKRSYVFSDKDLAKWQKFADRFLNGNLTASINYLANYGYEKLKGDSKNERTTKK